MKLALLFPGQGSQVVGMGQALAASSEAAKRAFETADAALGRSISTLCFEGPDAELALTFNTQPALVATSMAVLAALRERHPDLPAPAFAAGHSLGEYSALVAAGALALEDAVRIVELRGRAMQDAVPPGEGAMAAILGGDREAVVALCDEARHGDVLEPANFNAPSQIVISGRAAAVARAIELAPARKLKAKPLNVSAPFHCSLMASAARAVETALASVAFAKPRFPIVSNVDAAPHDEPEVLRSCLVRQVDAAVLWEQSVVAMADAGVTHALEIGPGKVLANLVKRIDKRIAVLSVGDADALEQVPAFLG
ncbi:MAG TPA: ACP S-malonyltransferase [Polyangiaceae bacterium]|nr:ACP S-malonyltransferase [Polyangiaceae bacterium]